MNSDATDSRIVGDPNGRGEAYVLGIDGDPADIVQEILNNPEDFYVNIHNPELPAGAVRGPLVSTVDHSHRTDCAREDAVQTNGAVGCQAPGG